jgi:hypothetical protein
MNNQILDFTLGIFCCEFAGTTPSGLRWKMTNTFTSIAHFTYGTLEEVRKSAERQNAAWQRKNTAVKRLGSAWRVVNNDLIKKKRAANGVAETKVPQDGVGAGEAEERLAEPDLRSA